MSSPARELKLNYGQAKHSFVLNWDIEVDRATGKNCLFESSTGKPKHNFISLGTVSSYFDLWRGLDESTPGRPKFISVPDSDGTRFDFECFLAPKENYGLEVFAKVTYVRNGKNNYKYKVMGAYFDASTTRHKYNQPGYSWKMETGLEEQCTLPGSNTHDWMKLVLPQEINPSLFKSIELHIPIQELIASDKCLVPKLRKRRNNSEEAEKVNESNATTSTVSPSIGSQQNQEKNSTTGAAVAAPAVLMTQEFLFSTSYSDVTICCGDKEFPAHQIIICSKSSVFRTMFDHPTEEALTQTIKIEDAEPEIVAELLRFIYSGEVTDLEKNAKELFLMADKYDVLELKNLSQDILLVTLNLENVLERFEVGELLNSHPIIDKCVHLIKENKQLWNNASQLKDVCNKYPELLLKLLKL